MVLQHETMSCDQWNDIMWSMERCHVINVYLPVLPYMSAWGRRLQARKLHHPSTTNHLSNAHQSEQNLHEQIKKKESRITAESENT